MGKLNGQVPISKLAEIARDVTVAAINNLNLKEVTTGNTGQLGTSFGTMYVRTLKEIADAEI